MHDQGPIPPSPSRISKLDNPVRLQTQVSEPELARLLDLRGDEDILDLGSGTGFYTDRVAALTTGFVYAVEILPAMNEHYRARGVPANVRLIQGDITALTVGTATDDTGRDASPAGAALQPASADLACTIATWHEIRARLDLPAVAQVLRPGGRLLVIDWRRDAGSWESGPPQAERYTADEVVASLAPHFAVRSAEKVGRFMFAVTARRS